MELKSEDSSKKSTGGKDEELLDLAKKELLREIKCASLRAEQFGAHSWAKPQNYVPSKRFLRHLLVSASRDNDRREQNCERRRADATKRTYASKHLSSHPEHATNEKHSKRKGTPRVKESSSKDRKNKVNGDKYIKKKHSSER